MLCSSSRSASSSSTCSSTLAPASRSLGIGVLGRVVADAADARREDHRRRADPRQHLRVVAGARRQAVRRVAEPLRGLLDEQHGVGIERHGSNRASERLRDLDALAAARARGRSPRARPRRRQGRPSSVLRRSTVSTARPGITFTRSGWRSRRPTVATWCPPSSAARRRTYVDDLGGGVARRRAASTSASCRRGSTDRRSSAPATRCPARPSTAPIVMPRASSTGPCSMCSSTNAARRGARARQRTGVADAHELVADGRAVDGRDVERLLERDATDVDEASPSCRAGSARPPRW